MARPSKKQLDMAKLYVQGPAHVKGRWAVCATAAGFDEPPAVDDEMMRMLIEREGGNVLPDAPDAAQKYDPISSLMDAKEIGIPWTKLYGRLADVIESLANGSVKASAAQVSMLKEVIKEAKAEMAKEASGATHVVLLPTLGSGADVHLDPQWRARIAALEAPDASS
jgi:hypothetical protein